MKLKSLHDLYIVELQDLYYAEQQLVKALPKMAEAAASPELRSAFLQHLDETKIHVNRLEDVFEKAGEKPKTHKCEGIEGIIEEGKDLMDEDAEPVVRDAALISAAQRAEHYEIAVYGCVRTYADQLGYELSARILQHTLDEEGQADKKLTEIAMRRNLEAVRAAY